MKWLLDHICNHCCLAIIIVIMATFYFIIKVIIEKDKPKNILYPSFSFAITLVVAFLAVFAVVHHHPDLINYIKNKLNSTTESNQGQPGSQVANQPNPNKPPAIIVTYNSKLVYDTNINNNRYIIGPLTKSELKSLDRLLNYEERKGGTGVTKAEMNRLRILDENVRDAYQRWRYCHQLNRNTSHVVYPSMRR